MPLEFISNLSEARLFPEGRYSLRYYNGKDITNLMFLHMMGIQILKYENLDEAKIYLRGIETWNYNYWISARNEIYACLHLIAGKYNQETRTFLKDYEHSEHFLNFVRFHDFDFRKYVRLLYAGAADTGFERRYFMELQQDLRISDSFMMNIRGYVASWPTLEPTMKRVAIQRLLQYMRVVARQSQLTRMLEVVYQRMNAPRHELPPIPTVDAPILQQTPVREGLFPFIKK